MKKGKKMPSIEVEGHSEAHFVLKDGKIIKVDARESGRPESLELDALAERAPKRPGE